MAEHKTYSWIKHAVRRWKELYLEILTIEGQVDWVNPLSEIFTQESLKAKTIDALSQGTPEPTPSKQEPVTSSERTPFNKPSSKPKRKRGKGRFSVKIKELQTFLIRPRPFF